MYLIYLMSLSFYLGAIVIFRKLRHDNTAILPFYPGINSTGVQYMWFFWVLFLLITTPMCGYIGDMQVWIQALKSVWNFEALEPAYVYLPVYAQTLGAIGLPFVTVFSGSTDIIAIIVIKSVLVAAYAYIPRFLALLAPSSQAQSPLIIIFNPVTIFYLYFGANHILMLSLLVLGVFYISNRRWIIGGVFLGLSMYKYLTAGAVLFLLWKNLQQRQLEQAIKLTVGITAASIPSMLYFLDHTEYLIRILSSFGGIGSHSRSLEPFHFFHFLAHTEFRVWYTIERGWILIAGICVTFITIIELSGRLSMLQVIGLILAIFAFLSPEPFRLEAALGFLWLDALQKDSRIYLGAIIFTVFAHTLAWFPFIIPKFLEATVAYSAVEPLWLYKGTFIGTALLCAGAASLWSSFGQMSKPVTTLYAQDPESMGQRPDTF